MMKIVSFRRGRKTQRVNQVIVKIDGVNDRDKAKEYTGKKVQIKFSKAYIIGVVMHPHGDSGRVVVRFRRGLPGQAINKEINLAVVATKKNT
jgi:large subunit ribosomal protein L35Ae